MNRLTKVYENGRVTIDGTRFGVDQAVLDSEVASNKAIAAAVKRLAELEDAEEAGLLVRLPCKVGDIVYVPNRWENEVRCFHVDRIEISKSGTCYCEKQYANQDICDLKSKTVFLTYEEAEQALKERTDNG